MIKAVFFDMEKKRLIEVLSLTQEYLDKYIKRSLLFENYCLQN